jgi:catechol 2,3-dioxygenase-like lactoylglutathione lyase family enzyme
MDMKLEVVVIPVSDVDRAIAFYKQLGWRQDADISGDNESRVVQFTPPGSSCSIIFGAGITDASPGSAQDLVLVVNDVELARQELIGHGAEVSEVFHGGIYGHKGRLPGPDPERRSYFSVAAFNDPDGNGWLVQEITERLPGR